MIQMVFLSPKCGESDVFSPTGRRGFRRLHTAGARFGFSPGRAKRSARASRAGIRLRGGRTRRKKPTVSSFLPIILFPSGAPRARFIVVPLSGFHPLAVATGMGWLPPQRVEISLLAAPEKWAAILSRNAPLRASARPYLRQQMPQIFGQTLYCLLSLRRKRGDSQEGRNLRCLPSSRAAASVHASNRP